MLARHRRRLEHGELTDLAELMHGGERGEHRVSADFCMAADHGVIRQHNVIGDIAVMSNMSIRHDEAMRADARRARFTGAAMNRHELANDVVIANEQMAGIDSAVERSILRVVAENRAAVNVIVAADRRVLVHDRVRTQNGVIADAATGSDERAGADRNTGAQFGGVIDDRRRVDVYGFMSRGHIPELYRGRNDWRPRVAWAIRRP